MQYLHASPNRMQHAVERLRLDGTLDEKKKPIRTDMGKIWSPARMGEIWPFCNLMIAGQASRVEVFY